jgi:hypothetical protein
MFTVTKYDVAFFPFTEAELAEGTSNLDQEYSLYANRRGRHFDAIDLGEVAPREFKGNLIVVGHGTQEAAHKHMIGASRAMRSAPEVAKNIADMEFPKGPDSEILVWSCHSGVIGGFAQLLALHLIKHGYVGKKVWGCKVFSGLINERFKLTGRATENGVSGTLRESDLSFYIGR